MFGEHFIPPHLPAPTSQEIIANLFPGFYFALTTQAVLAAIKNPKDYSIRQHIGAWGLMSLALMLGNFIPSAWTGRHPALSIGESVSFSVVLGLIRYFNFSGILEGILCSSEPGIGNSASPTAPIIESDDDSPMNGAYTELDSPPMRTAQASTASFWNIRQGITNGLNNLASMLGCPRRTNQAADLNLDDLSAAYTATTEASTHRSRNVADFGADAEELHGDTDYYRR